MGVKRKTDAGPSKASNKNKKAGASNPFEFRKNKERTAVLGKIKETHKIGHARTKALELRNNTLLQEMEQQDKHNTFIDSREKKEVPTKGLTSHELVKVKFDKLMGKAPKERGIVKKKNIYNLADDEIAYTGSALGQKRPAPEPDMDEEDGEAEEGEAGAVKDNGKRKTNKERYAEIIAKSKYHKHLRQKEKEERENVTEELNEQFTQLQESLFSTKRTKNDEQPEEKKADDDYMKLLRTFEMEGRAPASDRSKSTEEIMKEENEKLLKLEEDRLKRMLGELQGEKPDTSRLTSGDDLTDDYLGGDMLDEDDDGAGADDRDDAEILADLLDENRRGRGMEEEEDEGDFHEDALEEDEESESDDEAEEEVKEVEVGEKGEIPFRIDVPEDYKAFAELMEGRSAAERAVIVERIMVGNHYTLNRAQNVPKMRVFLRILWRRFTEVGKFKGVAKGTTTAEAGFKELNHIAKHLWDLAQQFPEITYNIVKDTLEKLYTKFSENMNNAETEPLTVQIIVVLQVIGNLFPTTDFHNTVVTPTFNFLGHAISLSPIIKVSQLTRALFLTSLSLNWLSESHRFIAEPLTLLGSFLERFADPKPDTQRYYMCPSLLPFDSKNFQVKSKSSSLSPKSLDFASLVFSEETIATDQQKIDFLNLALQLTSKYFDSYTDGNSKTTYQDCAPQLFGPIKASLAKIEALELCKPIQDVVRPLLAKMTKKFGSVEVTRKALMLQDMGPVTMETLNPNYNAEYNGKKAKLSELDERVQKHKARQRVRKEQLKAEKELKRDAQFVANQRFQHKKMEDEKSKQHTNKVMALLQKEAHEKKMDHIRKNPLKFSSSSKKR